LPFLGCAVAKPDKDAVASPNPIASIKVGIITSELRNRDLRIN
jgi:hypothetical protein